VIGGTMTDKNSLEGYYAGAKASVTFGLGLAARVWPVSATTSSWFRSTGRPDRRYRRPPRQSEGRQVTLVVVTIRAFRI
jgi:hypothetical protein